MPAGFHVVEAVKIPETDPRFSLVNMCFDAKGRLLVSQEGGPILLCTKPDKDGVLQEVKPYCTQVKNCHGMCWVEGRPLPRRQRPEGARACTAAATPKDADKIDEVTLLHAFNGGMGEHGPHAILHGPDDWLYVVIGNHAQAPRSDKLAANSPLRRWPTGGMGPDQGKPDTTEDVLLPRLNDANGHAANILAPGGTIWRMDNDGKNMSPGRGRLPQSLRRRVQPRRRAVHLRQRHGMGRGPAVVSAGARLPLPAGRRLRLAHRGGQHAGLLPRQPAAAVRDGPRLAGRPGVLRSQRFPGEVPRRAASWPTGRSA